MESESRDSSDGHFDSTTVIGSVVLLETCENAL